MKKENNLKKAWDDEQFLYELFRYTLFLGFLVMAVYALISALLAYGCYIANDVVGIAEQVVGIVLSLAMAAIFVVLFKRTK